MRGFVLALLLMVCAPAWATEIACTEAALEAQIAALNSSCTGDKEITFSCSAGTTIYINDNLNTRKTCDGGEPDQITCTNDSDCTSGSQPTPCALNLHGCNGSGLGCTGSGTPYQCCTGSGTGTCCSGDDTDRDITCDGVTIDGENKITFSFDPPCNARLAALGDTCSELEGQAELFTLLADGITIKNFDVEYSWEGIRNRGVDNVVDNVDADWPCDDAFTFTGEGTADYAINGVLSNSTVTNGCDKCVTVQTDKTTYPEYNAIIRNVTFNSCRQPINVADGLALIDNCDFLYDATWGMTYNFHTAIQIGQTASSGFRGTAYTKDNYFNLARAAVEVEGNGNWITLGGDHFYQNYGCGARVDDGGQAVVENTTFEENGGTVSSTCEGGFFVDAGLNGGSWSGGEVDLGGGSVDIDGITWSSSGGNRFIANVDGADAAEDVANDDATGILAQGNWWNDAGGPVSGAINENPGTVDTSSFLTSDPQAGATCGDNTTDPGELCDGTDLNGMTCSDVGAFVAGTLACSGSCDAWVTSGCNEEVTPVGSGNRITGGVVIKGGKI